MKGKDKFKNYKELKKYFTEKYRGFSIDCMLAIPIWKWANAPVDIKQMKGFFQFVNLKFLENISSLNIIYSDVERIDHQTTYHAIVKKVSDQFEMIELKSGIKVSFMFSLKNVIEAWRYTNRIEILPFLKKACVTAYLCRYFNTIDKLLDLRIPEVKTFVAFCPVLEIQNMISQYFNHLGTRVVGLSHGAHFVYENEIPVDCVNYENLQFENLVWGQMTKDEYVRFGVDKKMIHVAGYPKDVHLEEMKSDEDMIRCLVLLCRSLYDSSNKKLLDILSHFKGHYTFYIKLHPSCDYHYYHELCKKYGFSLISKDVLLTDCMNKQKYDFAIAVNTTSYYEIQIAGIPCLRFEDGDAYDMMRGIDEDKFSNIKEFERSMSWLKNTIITGNYDLMRKKSLHYNLGIGIDNYRKLLL